MANLTVENKNIRIISLFIISLFFINSLIAQEVDFNINFQSGFNNDNITFTVNNFEIFNDFELNTNKVLGLAASIKVTSTEKGITKFQYSNFIKNDVVYNGRIIFGNKIKLSLMIEGETFTKIFCIIKVNILAC